MSATQQSEVKLSLFTKRLANRAVDVPLRRLAAVLVVLAAQFARGQQTAPERIPYWNRIDYRPAGCDPKTCTGCAAFIPEPLDKGTARDLLKLWQQGDTFVITTLQLYFCGSDGAYFPAPAWRDLDGIPRQWKCFACCEAGCTQNGNTCNIEAYYDSDTFGCNLKGGRCANGAYDKEFTLIINDDTLDGTTDAPSLPDNTFVTCPWDGSNPENLGTVAEIFKYGEPFPSPPLPPTLPKSPPPRPPKRPPPPPPARPPPSPAPPSPIPPSPMPPLSSPPPPRQLDSTTQAGPGGAPSTSPGGTSGSTSGDTSSGSSGGSGTSGGGGSGSSSGGGNSSSGSSGGGDGGGGSSGGSSSSANVGTIAAAVVGGVAVVAVAVAALLFLRFRRKQRHRQSKPKPGAAATNGVLPAPASGREDDSGGTGQELASYGAHDDAAAAAVAVVVARGDMPYDPWPPVQPVAAVQAQPAGTASGTPLQPVTEPQPGAVIVPAVARTQTPANLGTGSPSPAVGALAAQQMLLALFASTETSTGATTQLSPSGSGQSSLAHDPLLAVINSQLDSLAGTAGTADTADTAGTAGSTAAQPQSGTPSANGLSTGSTSTQGLGASVTPLLRVGGSGTLRPAVQPWEIGWQELRGNFDRVLGEGSYGRVYLASWHETPVAVKVILSKGAVGAADGSAALAQAQAAVVQELQKEAELMARLRHPNIVQFMAICVVPACIVTEYCSRRSLYDVLRTAARDASKAAELDWSRRLSLLLDAATGMLYLHNRSPPIIHRDLKTANLLVDANWRAKVSDFNLSSSRLILDASRSGASTSGVGGAMNPRWLAPEVMQGASATLAADVYSFGVVCWELLAWELPWSNISNWQIVGTVINGGRLELPAPGQVRGLEKAAGGQLPGYGAFVALVRRCWEPEPFARPGFAEIVHELRSLVQHATTGGAPDPQAAPQRANSSHSAAPGRDAQHSYPAQAAKAGAAANAQQWWQAPMQGSSATDGASSQAATAGSSLAGATS